MWINQAVRRYALESFLLQSLRTPMLFNGWLIDWLWVKLAPAVAHSPALNRPCLRAWIQLTYFLSFPTSSIFPLPFAMSRIFYFAQCPKRQGGVNNFRVTLVFSYHYEGFKYFIKYVRPWQINQSSVEVQERDGRSIESNWKIKIVQCHTGSPKVLDGVSADHFSLDIFRFARAQLSTGDSWTPTETSCVVYYDKTINPSTSLQRETSWTNSKLQTVGFSKKNLGILKHRTKMIEREVEKNRKKRKIQKQNKSENKANKSKRRFSLVQKSRPRPLTANRESNFYRRLVCVVVPDVIVVSFCFPSSHEKGKFFTRFSAFFSPFFFYGITLIHRVRDFLIQLYGPVCLVSIGFSFFRSSCVSLFR